jgi:uncharacterized membrane protein (UPF0182 family)
VSGSPQRVGDTLRGGRTLLAVLVAIGTVAAVGRSLTGLYVEVLWQAQSGYSGVFWRRVAAEWGLQVAAGLLVAAAVFLNLRVASTTLGGIQIRRQFGNIEISEQIPRKYVTWALGTAAALLGLWFGAAVPPGIGRQVLLALSAPAWGVTDPVLHQDVGFYVFWYPVLASGITYAMIVAFLVFTLATAGYAATGAVTWTRGHLRAHKVARVHLGMILSVSFVLLALRLWLGRYELLMSGGSSVQGIFGFTDAHARLPALRTLAVISLGAAVATAWGALRDRGWAVVASFGLVVLSTVLIGNVYPSLIQNFRVEPNELQRETPYIEHALDFTRRGFGLDATERRRLPHDADVPIEWEEAGRQFAGLPVWGRDPLRTTFQEVEARFSYYDFDDVFIDRYPSPEGLTPVAIAVRKVDPAGIQGVQGSNWQNTRLRERYVSGMGAVAAVANRRSPDGRPEMLLAGIPPVPAESREAGPPLTLERPQVYYGSYAVRPGSLPGGADYAIVTPGEDQYRSPDDGIGVPGVDLPEGIPLTSLARSALLAWRFGTANLLFSSEIQDESRLIHRRDVVERAEAIAPFLRFPEAPYPVIHDGRLVWVLEAFAGTRAFPLSAQHPLGGVGTSGRFVRYVRNSVKVTVDAVTGAISFYRVPIHDPLADGIARAYPGLFEPIESMPEGLRSHLRYPRALLDLQARVLLRYHQATAPVFHGQQDVWSVPEELAKSTNPVPYEAEYGIWRLPGEEEPRFQLSTVFVPSGRENLTAMFVGRTDSAGRPETVLLDVPVDEQLLGPRQIEAQVEQDPLISQQFSLWRTGGSEVWTGHLHLVPVGERLLYVEPVFLAATNDAIPELRRFVVSDGREVVMTETLPEAFLQLSGRGTPAAGDLADSPPSRDPSPRPGGTENWPAEALRLLEHAEGRARAGDWPGYGAALDALRELLRALQTGSG